MNELKELKRSKYDGGHRMSKTLSCKMKSALITSALGCAILSFPQSGVHADTMKNPKKMSMTGCVAEKDGKYMMMNKEHPDGVELMASQDMMKPHVGHMMKVTGTMSTGGAMSKMDPPSGS